MQVNGATGLSSKKLFIRVSHPFSHQSNILGQEHKHETRQHISSLETHQRQSRDVEVRDVLPDWVPRMRRWACQASARAGPAVRTTQTRFCSFVQTSRLGKNARTTTDSHWLVCRQPTNQEAGKCDKRGVGSAKK